MSTRERMFVIRLVLAWVILFLFASCSNNGSTPTPAAGTPSIEVASATSIPTSSPTAIPPTSTQEPLAALVNGTGITLAEYQAELDLYKAAVGTELATDAEKRVLDDLIDQVLLAQAAEMNGFVVDEIVLQERTQSLVDQLGSEDALDEWITRHGYTQQTFQRSLARSLAAAWMRDAIADTVPEVTEQTHARQILLYNSQEADEVYAQLQRGDDFGNLALKYDPLTGGELGWFSRGYLLDAELEEVAFSLEPDEYSPVIETLAGFHILQVLERDPERLLEPEMLLILQSRAVQEWLQERRSESEIQILLN